MKELEKTKRISIAAVLSILLVIIALLSYKMPKNLYKISTKNTLEKITNTDFFVTMDSINNEHIVLVDIRNANEFEKGHIKNAINIYAPEILSEENMAVFDELRARNKTILFYGKNPNDAITPYTILLQLGYDNLKVLKVENTYYQSKLITKNVELENSVADIPQFIEESIKKATAKPKPVIINTPKKVITVKKKKKAMPEGGC